MFYLNIDGVLASGRLLTWNHMGRFVCLDDSASDLIQNFRAQRVVRTDHEHGLTRRKARKPARKLHQFALEKVSP